MGAITNLLLASLAPLLVLSAPAALQTPAPDVNAAPTTWVHPGYVVDRSQLDFVKAQVAAGAQPWTSAYSQMLKDSDQYGLYATGTSGRKSTPTSNVGCGPTTNPDHGCTAERGDALAAWANALAWYISGNTNYAQNAIGLMNRWSYVVQSAFQSCTRWSCATLANIFKLTLWTTPFYRRRGPVLHGLELASSFVIQPRDYGLNRILHNLAIC